MNATEVGRLRDDEERCAVRFERLYDSTPAELWAALTDPEQLRGWLAHVRSLDLRVGGEVHFQFDGDEEVRGEILALEPERVLEYTWTYPGEDESVVRFEVVPREQGTLLVLDHRRLGRDAGVGYGAGWHAHLDMLDATLRGGAVEFAARFAEVRTPYAEQAAELGWTTRPVSPVRDALYRGDRPAAEAAAGGELDVFDAAALGRVERLRALLDADPELVRAFSDDGFTPLHLACFSGGGDAVRLLVERGAPLDAVARSPFAEVPPLGTAAFARRLDAARALLDAGADPNGRGARGFTPLQTAAQNGDVPMVELLLERGADPELRADDGLAAADRARTGGHVQVLALLGHGSKSD
ncbi:MAG TPA: SRPBCC domain-containing protein [Gaiellaceae bacterium]|nr:SRPBCC domain-containing protein [Gaiellaceae bacterium]